MFKINNLFIHPLSKLCPSGFAAITLFGHIFSSWSEDKIRNTNSGKILVNHENIHCIQANSLKGKWIEFYIIYIKDWFKNLFTFGFNINAYRNIPFEKEAYTNERNMNYKETHWENYK